MKKNFKRTLAKVMAVALTVALAGTAAPEADAAKKIKLSKKSITVTKGKTKKVTIKNVKAKKVKKLTVKTNKKKIATVKKSGKTAFKVTGKKAGSAKITATVKVKGQKKATKLTLKVTVKSSVKPDPTTAPTTAPTSTPTTAPATTAPSAAPTAAPSEEPTPVPTEAPTAAPTQAPVKVETEATEIKNIQLGGKNSKYITKFAVDESGTVECQYSKTAKYGSVYTYFDVEIPDGSSIEDIQSIKADIEGVSGDVTYKHVHLIAGDPDPDSPDAFPTATDIAYDYNNNTFGNVTLVGDSGQVSNITGSYEFELSEFMDSIKDDGLDSLKKVRFAVYLNVDGTASYKISNIKLIGKKGVAFKEGYETPGTTVDHTNDDPLEAGKASQNVLALNETAAIDIAPAASLYGAEVDATKTEVTSSDEKIVKVEKVNDAKYMVTRLDAKGDVTITVKVTLKDGVELSTDITIAAAKSAPDVDSLLSAGAEKLDLSQAFDTTNAIYGSTGVGATAGKDSYGNDVYTLNLSGKNDVAYVTTNKDLSKYKAVELIVKTGGKSDVRVMPTGLTGNWYSGDVQNGSDCTWPDPTGDESVANNFGVKKITLNLVNAQSTDGGTILIKTNEGDSFDANTMKYVVYAVAFVPKTAE